MWSYTRILLDQDLTPEDEDLLAELDLGPKSECSEDEDSGDGTCIFRLHYSCPTIAEGSVVSVREKVNRHASGVANLVNE